MLSEAIELVDIGEKFVEFELGVNEVSFVAVPLSSFVYTLCVIEDYGGRTNTLRYYIGVDGVEVANFT